MLQTNEHGCCYIVMVQCHNRTTEEKLYSVQLIFGKIASLNLYILWSTFDASSIFLVDWQKYYRHFNCALDEHFESC